MNVIPSLTEEELYDTKVRISGLKVAEIKDVLRLVGLTITGKKSDLQTRLITFLLLRRDAGDKAAVLALRTLVVQRCNGVPLQTFRDLYHAIESGSFVPGTNHRRSNHHMSTTTTMATSTVPTGPAGATGATGAAGAIVSTIHSKDSKPFHGHSLMFKENPFYKLVRMVHGSPQKLPATANSGKPVYSFVFKKEEWLQLKSGNSQRRIYLLCGKQLKPDTVSSNNVEVEYPPSVEVYINSKRVTQFYKGTKKLGTAQAINATDFVQKAPNLNTITMIYNPLENANDAYFLYLYIVELIPMENVLQAVINAPKINKQHAIKMLIEESGANDIVVANTQISLSDPFARTRIQYPIRSIFCEHIQCFDARMFLANQFQAPQWECPLCGKPLKIKDLAGCEYFDEILKATGDDIDEVIIQPNGTWHAKLVEDETPSPPVHRRQSEAKKRTEESPEIIEISDSDDNDDNDNDNDNDDNNENEDDEGDDSGNDTIMSAARATGQSDVSTLITESLQPNSPILQRQIRVNSDSHIPHVSMDNRRTAPQSREDQILGSMATTSLFSQRQGPVQESRSLLRHSLPNLDYLHQELRQQVPLWRTGHLAPSGSDERSIVNSTDSVSNLQRIPSSGPAMQTTTLLRDSGSSHSISAHPAHPVHLVQPSTQLQGTNSIDRSSVEKTQSSNFQECSQQHPMQENRQPRVQPQAAVKEFGSGGGSQQGSATFGSNSSLSTTVNNPNNHAPSVSRNGSILGPSILNLGGLQLEELSTGGHISRIPNEKDSSPDSNANLNLNTNLLLDNQGPKTTQTTTSSSKSTVSRLNNQYLLLFIQRPRKKHNSQSRIATRAPENVDATLQEKHQQQQHEEPQQQQQQQQHGEPQQLQQLSRQQVDNGAETSNVHNATSKHDEPVPNEGALNEVITEFNFEEPHPVNDSILPITTVASQSKSNENDQTTLEEFENIPLHRIHLLQKETTPVERQAGENEATQEAPNSNDTRESVGIESHAVHASKEKSPSIISLRNIILQDRQLQNQLRAFDEETVQITTELLSKLPYQNSDLIKRHIKSVLEEREHTKRLLAELYVRRIHQSLSLHLPLLHSSSQLRSPRPPRPPSPLPLLSPPRPALAPTPSQHSPSPPFPPFPLPHPTSSLIENLLPSTSANSILKTVTYPNFNQQHRHLATGQLTDDFTTPSGTTTPTDADAMLSTANNEADFSVHAHLNHLPDVLGKKRSLTENIHQDLTPISETTSESLLASEWSSELDKVEEYRKKRCIGFSAKGSADEPIELD